MCFLFDVLSTVYLNYNIRSQIPFHVDLTIGVRVHEDPHRVLPNFLGLDPLWVHVEVVFVAKVIDPSQEILR
jgi:hypothetical protein